MGCVHPTDSTGGGRIPLRRASGNKNDSGKDETGFGTCVMTILVSVGSTARKIRKVKHNSHFCARY